MTGRLPQIVALAVALLAALGAALLTPALDRQRADLQLSARPLGAGGEAHPTLTLLNALGGPGRGFAVIYLWNRTIALNEEGRFAESYQLAELISLLQSNYPAVWTFMAWDLAYNRSVATHTPEERWYFVTSGINLLRNRGISACPNSPRIYRELAWTFLHKIGDNADDAHYYYKMRLAREWHEVLGPPPPPGAEGLAVRSPEQMRQPRPFLGDPSARWMRRLVQLPSPPGETAAIPMPDRLADLERQDAGVAALAERLRGLGRRIDSDLLRAIGRIQLYQASAHPDLPGRSLQGVKDLDLGLIELLDRLPERDRPALERLLDFLRRRTLIDTYHMRPEEMLRLTEEYGPLDWRHPAAHALYWASMGVQRAEARRNTEGEDPLNTYRLVLHALQQLWRAGRVFLDPFQPADEPITYTPEIRLIPAYQKAFEEAGELARRGVFGPNMTAESFATGHENFLLEAAQDLYFYGRPDDGRAYYERARTLYGNAPESLLRQRYAATLEDYIDKDLPNEIVREDILRKFLYGHLSRGFVWLAHGDVARFESALAQCIAMHTRFNERAYRAPIAPGAPPQALPTFDRLLAPILATYLSDGAFPLMVRSRTWRNLPARLAPYQEMVFPHVVRRLDAEVAALPAGPDGSKPKAEELFPTPPGLTRRPRS